MIRIMPTDEELDEMNRRQRRVRAEIGQPLPSGIHLVRNPHTADGLPLLWGWIADEPVVVEGKK